MDSCSLVLTQVPLVAFNQQDTTDQLLSGFNPQQVIFLKSFRRILLTFNSPQEAFHCRVSLDNTCPWGSEQSPIRVYAIETLPQSSAEDNLLQLPERGRLFLLSPPASPPIDWVQHHEHSPIPAHLAHHPNDWEDFKLEPAAHSEARILSFVPTSGPKHETAPADSSLPCIVIENFDASAEKSEEGSLMNLNDWHPFGLASAGLPKTRLPPISR